MKISRYKPAQTAPQTPFERDLDKSLDRILTEIVSVLNSGANFKDNFDCLITTVTTDATPGVDTAIAHGRKHIPEGFIVLEKDKAAHIFSGNTLKDSTYFYIQSDVDSVKVKLMIF